MRSKFYKVTCNIDIFDGDVNLLIWEKWQMFENIF